MKKKNPYIAMIFFLNYACSSVFEKCEATPNFVFGFQSPLLRFPFPHSHNLRKSTVPKKMATGSFTHNSLRTKTLKTLIKTHRKLLKTSNLAYTILLVQERIS